MRDLWRRIGHVIEREGADGAGRLVRHVGASVLALATAPLLLRGCDAVGPGARTWGRPRVANAGAMVLGRRITLISSMCPVELETAPDGRLEVGDDTILNFGVSVYAACRVRLGHNVGVGPYATIADAERRVRGEPPAVAPRPVEIGDDVWIGARATILPGAVIGAGAVVSAGSVVDGVVPARAVVGGIPARVLRIMPEPRPAAARRSA
jgi:acetyltransferase-like isoleucine patch superfamily enzyme